MHINGHVARSIRDEAKRRHMTLGELITEAFVTRVRMVEKR